MHIICIFIKLAVNKYGVRMCTMFHHINIIMSGNKHYRRWIHMRFITQCNKRMAE